jgi:hypothetical protein
VRTLALSGASRRIDPIVALFRSNAEPTPKYETILSSPDFIKPKKTKGSKWKSGNGKPQQPVHGTDDSFS